MAGARNKFKKILIHKILVQIITLLLQKIISPVLSFEDPFGYLVLPAFFIE